MKSIISLFLFLFLEINSTKMPEGFSYVNDQSLLKEPPKHPIIIDLKYFGEDNFIGRKMPFYNKNVGIMTTPAAKALNEAQKKFNEKGYSIVMYDAYRPQGTVSYFVEWMNDANDTLRKKYHYPYVNNKIDMKDVYICSISGHTRGSTIDMSIIEIGTEVSPIGKYEERIFDYKKYPFLNDNTIDCGTSFDLMDPMSHCNNTIVSEQQQANRQMIREVMESCGFEVLPEEWWHFTLKNEPYPDTYFDFPIDEYETSKSTFLGMKIFLLVIFSCILL